MVTRGHKTLGDKWLLEHLFSNQSPLYLDNEVTPNTPMFHTIIRYHALR